MTDYADLEALAKAAKAASNYGVKSNRPMHDLHAACAPSVILDLLAELAQARSALELAVCSCEENGGLLSLPALDQIRAALAPPAPPEVT